MNYLTNNVFITKKLKPRLIYVFTIIIVILSIVLLFLLHVINVETFYVNKMVIKNVNNNYVGVVNVNMDEIDIILNNNKLNILDNVYNYSLVKIDELDVLSGHNVGCVYIDINDLGKFKVNNLVVNFKIKKDEQSIIKYIKNLF